MDFTQAKKLKEIEKENIRLKKLVADLSLDNAILKEVLEKKSDCARQQAARCQASRRKFGCLGTQSLYGDWTTTFNPAL
jgi:hypothetical protein